MKYAIEVEGKYTGIPTLLCDSPSETWRIKDELARCFSSNLPVGHVSVYDEFNELTYHSILDICEVIGSIPLSIEKTLVDIDLISGDPRLAGVCVVLLLGNQNNDQMKRLRPSDQIKIVDNKKNVWMLPVGQMWRTRPEDFNNDITI
jgi:hypothetical protein